MPNFKSQKVLPLGAQQCYEALLIPQRLGWMPSPHTPVFLSLSRRLDQKLLEGCAHSFLSYSSGA